jgi:DNA invertase Pin-like site-specific DNA recombinase
MRYLIYARVSERGSDWHAKGIATSSAEQVAACRAWISARDPDGEVLSPVIDEFATGGNTSRPGFAGIVRDIESGTTAWDVLVVFDIYRFSRSVRDGLTIIEKMEEHGKGFVSVRQQWDFSTPTGRMVMQLLLSVGEFQRREGAERTRHKMLSIARSGLWPAGCVPYGYRRAAPHNNLLVPHHEEASRVLEAFQFVAEGGAPAHAARIVGAKRLAWMYLLLANPVYAGRIVYGDVDVAGKQEPIVPPELFAAVQAMLPHRRVKARAERQAHAYALVGILHCAHGHPMQGCTQTKAGEPHPYYRCKACGVYVRADDIEAAVVEQVRTVAASPEVRAGLARALAEHIREKRRKTEPLIIAATEEKATANLAVAKLTKMALDGLVSADNSAWWNEELAKARATALEAAATVAELEKAGQAEEPSEEALGRSWARMAADLLDGSTEDRKRGIRAHVTSITAAGEGAWRVSYSLPGVDGSTLATKWHPQGEPVELRLTVARRPRSRPHRTGRNAALATAPGGARSTSSPRVPVPR